MKNQKGFIQIPLLVAIIAGVLVLGGGGYLGVKKYKNYQAEKAEKEKLSQEKEKRAQEQQKILESTQTEIEKLKEESTETKKQNQIQPSVSKQNISRITSQIIEFEDVLEGKIVDTDINCTVYATYNNLEVVDPSQIPSALPESKEMYRQRCLSFYVPLNLLRNKLVAEPETQNLRRILTSYIDSVRALAVYALDGGYSAPIIDKYSTAFDTYRLEAREELLRLQRQYNVGPRYITQ